MALVAASCLCLAAILHWALNDLQLRKVLNGTMLVLAIGYLPLALTVNLCWTAIASSIVAAALVFVIGFAAFITGWLSAGDVKLASVTTLWAGAALVVPLLVLATLFGGLVSLMLVILRCRHSAESPVIDDIAFSPGLVVSAVALSSGSQWFATS